MMDRNQPSQGKGVVIFPQEVLEKIDRNKDNLSRAEFIESCLDALLETKEVAERGEVAGAVSREEFGEFKKGIKSLQHAFIELLLAFTIEPVAKASKEEQERLVQRVRELMEEQ